jgi:ribosomal protein S18 acetylase RimI-like enzyme
MLVEVVIREATADDYAVLCELFDEVDGLHRDHLPQIFQKPTGPAWEEEYVRGLITDGNVGLFVAEVNEVVLGVIHAVIRDTPAMPILVPRRYAIVESIGVKSDFRGSGIGRMLMHRIHEWAIVKGAIAIELNVHEFNKGAISFYRKLGYDTVSRKMSRLLGRRRAAG